MRIPSAQDICTQPFYRQRLNFHSILKASKNFFSCACITESARGEGFQWLNHDPEQSRISNTNTSQATVRIEEFSSASLALPRLPFHLSECFRSGRCRSGRNQTLSPIARRRMGIPPQGVAD